MKYNELKEFYSTKKELIDELNTTYERIEFKIIGEYLKKEKKIKFPGIKDIGVEKEMKNAELYKSKIKSFDKKFKSNYKEYPNNMLFGGIKEFQKFSSLIMEKDENKLNDIKNRVNDFVNNSEKEILKILNFNVPMIEEFI